MRGGTRCNYLDQVRAGGIRPAPRPSGVGSSQPAAQPGETRPLVNQSPPPILPPATPVLALASRTCDTVAAPAAVRRGYATASSSACWSFASSAVSHGCASAGGGVGVAVAKPRGGARGRGGQPDADSGRAEGGGNAGHAGVHASVSLEMCHVLSRLFLPPLYSLRSPLQGKVPILVESKDPHVLHMLVLCTMTQVEDLTRAAAPPGLAAGQTWI